MVCIALVVTRNLRGLYCLAHGALPFALGQDAQNMGVDIIHRIIVGTEVDGQIRIRGDEDIVQH